jgi:hypothetical protein
MKNGDTIWVRDIHNMSEKTKCTFEFEKNDQVIVSFDEHRYLCVFDKSCIVDPPTDEEAAIAECNKVLTELYKTAKSSAYMRNMGFFSILESMGYKLTKQKCKK